ALGVGRWALGVRTIPPTPNAQRPTPNAQSLLFTILLAFAFPATGQGLALRSPTAVADPLASDVQAALPGVGAAGAGGFRVVAPTGLPSTPVTDPKDGWQF